MQAIKCKLLFQKTGGSAENSLQISGVVVGDGAVGKASRIHPLYLLRPNYSSMMGIDMPTYILYHQCLPGMVHPSFFIPALHTYAS